MRGEETILNYSHIRKTANGNTHRGRESAAQLASTLCCPIHRHTENAQRWQDQTGENRWHNLVRKCVSGELERMVSVHFASRKTRAIFVGHHDRTGAGLWCITKSGLWRGKSWTRAPWQDAWGATTWEGWCRTPWQMVALARKVTADKGRGAQFELVHF